MKKLNQAQRKYRNSTQRLELYNSEYFVIQMDYQ